MSEENLEFEFKFQFGKKKRSIFDYVKLGILLNFTIDSLALLPWWKREQVFNVVDELQLKSKYDFLNDYIIKDKDLLDFRLNRELTKAIADYENRKSTI